MEAMISMTTGPAVVGHGSAVMYRSPRSIGRRMVEFPHTGNESLRTLTPLQEIVVAQDPPNTGMFTSKLDQVIALNRLSRIKRDLTVVGW
jgi:hypothetical protein